jgi:transposase
MIPALSGTPPAGVRVLIAMRPVDFRRGADGLASTVQSVLRQDPFSGTIFVFRSKRPRMLIRGAWLCLGRQSGQQARNFGLKLEA